MTLKVPKIKYVNDGEGNSWRTVESQKHFSAEEWVNFMTDEKNRPSPEERPALFDISGETPQKAPQSSQSSLADEDKMCEDRTTEAEGDALARFFGTPAGKWEGLDK